MRPCNRYRRSKRGSRFSNQPREEASGPKADRSASLPRRGGERENTVLPNLSSGLDQGDRSPSAVPLRGSRAGGGETVTFTRPLWHGGSVSSAGIPPGGLMTEENSAAARSRVQSWPRAGSRPRAGLDKVGMSRWRSRSIAPGHARKRFDPHWLTPMLYSPFGRRARRRTDAHLLKVLRWPQSQAAHH